MLRELPRENMLFTRHVFYDKTQLKISIIEIYCTVYSIMLQHKILFFSKITVKIMKKSSEHRKKNIFNLPNPSSTACNIFSKVFINLVALSL